AEVGAGAVGEAGVAGADQGVPRLLSATRIVAVAAGPGGAGNAAGVDSRVAACGIGDRAVGGGAVLERGESQGQRAAVGDAAAGVGTVVAEGAVLDQRAAVVVEPAARATSR